MGRFDNPKISTYRVQDECRKMKGKAGIMKKLFITLLLFISAQNVNAYTYSSENFDQLRQASQSQRLKEWKISYFQRSDELFIDLRDKTRGLIELASVESNYGDTYRALKSVHQNIYTQKIRSGAEDIEAYLSPFVSISNISMGLSQFVLETAMACRFFAYSESADAYRQKACRAYPVLASATAQLAFDLTPAKGLSFRNQGVLNSQVDTGRGLVLTRALHPLFNAYLINDSTINGSNWTESNKARFKRLFNQSAFEINESLIDFFALKFVDYKLNSQTEDQAFQQMLNGYNPDTILARCIEKHRQKIIETPSTSKIRRCSSNHIIAGYFGRLMNQIVQGHSIIANVEEFKSIIDHGILFDQNNHIMSDLYRKFENKGITYSLLQLRFITAAAELIQNRGMDLYAHSDYKLLSALNFMAKLTSVDSDPLLIQTYLKDCASRNSCAEYNKYVSPSDELKRLNWARNYGFYMAPQKRFCSNSVIQNRFTALCRVNDARNLSNTSAKVHGTVHNLQNDINAGPIQLLLGQ